jgi:hypothetical protein
VAVLGDPCAGCELRPAGDVALGGRQPVGGSAGSCCGGTHGATSMRSERATVAAAGAVGALLAPVPLTLSAGRHPAAVVLVLATVALGIWVAWLGATALRRTDPVADARVARAVRLLPSVVIGVLATFGVTVARFVLG